ncbi:PTS glucitol/sorbitol transporter subunit IIA [Vagococcus zengguangii]|uniref:PTS sorbitol transporter subunit IIA n=1 Tax=Vagococcus zengguangii TaxID=2571750 RepID=A0A4D7CRW7_9ENTE|nr:PTS glucitol/sorbitol transporter subunit IIA [Vagococcus zengguangii]QCI85763.1 PTS sorbitol transporter subunit IIA [Vagococcus zengguangii]TLG81704.1 PTS sorbitol transporter subunit IIA [Vagococcus zengguangii]
MVENSIVSIGEQAVSSQDNMLILFDESATKDINNVAVIHVNKQEQSTYQLEVGHTLTFGDQDYTVIELGERVNASLEMMGHATLFFKERTDEDLLANAIYLSPATLPTLEVGMKLTFN